MHKAIVREGEIGADSLVQAAVDRERRHAAEQAHTGTHIVHAALHQILGPEALQRGSFNKAGYLRFDFAWGEGLSAATRSEIEEVSNIAIRNNFRVETKVMGLAEAKALGAMALFGENYGNEVRVVEIDGAWSRELCGGTHVGNTALIGSLSLLGDQSVGSGNRRVEAFVGHGRLPAPRRRARPRDRADRNAEGSLRAPRGPDRHHADQAQDGREGTRAAAQGPAHGRRRAARRHRQGRRRRSRSSRTTPARSAARTTSAASPWTCGPASAPSPPPSPSPVSATTAR